jgi:hypothetical protein
MIFIGWIIAILMFTALAAWLLTQLIRFIQFDIRFIRYLWTRKW